MLRVVKEGFLGWPVFVGQVGVVGNIQVIATAGGIVILAVGIILLSLGIIAYTEAVYPINKNTCGREITTTQNGITTVNPNSCPDPTGGVGVIVTGVTLLIAGIAITVVGATRKQMIKP